MMRLGMVMALGAAAWACGGLGRAAFRQPTVTLRDVRLVALGPAGGDLEVDLAVVNPNEFRLDTRRITYRVLVADSIQLASGELARQATVQAGDSTMIRLPVSFSYSGLGTAARLWLLNGAVTYRIAGDVTVASVVGNFTVPYSSVGRYSTARR